MQRYVKLLPHEGDIEIDETRLSLAQRIMVKEVDGGFDGGLCGDEWQWKE